MENCYKWWLGSQMYVYTQNYQNYRDSKMRVQILHLAHSGHQSAEQKKGKERSKFNFTVQSWLQTHF